MSILQDSQLLNHLLQFTDCLIGTIQVILVVSSFLPQLLIPFFPILVFTFYVAHQYVHVSRELKRIESLKKTPVFVLFSETLHGLAIIRSFPNQPNRFFGKVTSLIDQMNQCHIYLWICNRWLNFRMQCLGAIVSGIVAAAIVYSVSGELKHPEGSILTSAVAGLTLMYTLGFCDSLTFMARFHADVSDHFFHQALLIMLCVSSVKWT